MQISTRNNSPLITVIVVCYNHERFVVECLDSVRGQTFRDYQFIIMDDSSTDDSVNTIRQWIETHSVDCLFIHHAVNQGICKTLNEALRHAKGEFIASISADDLWFPDKLERQLVLLRGRPDGVGFIYGNYCYIDEKGNDILDNDGKVIHAFKGYLHPQEDWILEQLLTHISIQPATVLIRRACFLSVGGYDENLSYEDHDMFFRLSQKYKAIYDPFISVKYRNVSTSLWHRLSESCERVESNIISYLKVFDSNKDSAPILGLVKKCLLDCAKSLYVKKCKNKKEYFFKILAVHRGFTVCCLTLGVFLNIPYTLLAFPTRFVRRILSRARGD